jgi:hypothetical protein
MTYILTVRFQPIRPVDLTKYSPHHHPTQANGASPSGSMITKIFFAKTQVARGKRFLVYDTKFGKVSVDQLKISFKLSHFLSVGKDSTALIFKI